VHRSSRLSFRRPNSSRRFQSRHLAILTSVILAIATASQVADAQATLTAFEQSAAQAFNPNNKTFSSISMAGSGVWTAGSLSESGTVTLQIFANGSFTEKWELPTQSHTYESTITSVVTTCTYTDPSGKQTVISDMSCMQSIPWFAPWFGLESVAGGQIVVTDTTQSLDVSSGNERLSFRPNVTPPNGTTALDAQAEELFQQGTLVNVSYDLKTSVPVSIRFDQLLDSNLAHSIQREASFADYRTESGYLIPHHIQRFIQRTLQADITITSVTAQ